MDAAEACLHQGDPYIGLYLAAEKVQRFIRLAEEMPRHLLPNAYMVLRDPDIWDDIAAFLQAILSGTWVSTTWGYLNAHIILPVEAWLQNTLLGPFLAWCRSAGSGPIHFAYDILVQFVGWAGGYLSSFVNWMWSLPTNLAAGFVGWFTYGQEQVERLATWWGTTVWPGISVLIESLTNLPGDLWATFLGWFGWTGAQVERLATWWGTTIWPGISVLIETLTNLPADLWATFLGWFGWTQAQVERLASWWVGLPAFLGTVVLPLLWLSIDEWIASPSGSFKGVWDRLIDVASATAEDAARGFAGTIDHLFGGFQTIPQTFLAYVAKIAGTDLAMEPSRALPTVGSLYSISMAAGTGAHLLSTALNIVPTLNWVGASQLAGFVAEAAGFDFLTRATYGTLIDDALTWPLRYHWNQMLRPRIPTEGSVFLMGRKRGLSRDEFGRAMAFHGLPEWWIDKEYQFFWTDPSPYWLLRMSEHATPEIQPSALFLPWLDEWLPNWRDDPWAWFKMKLMLAGFEQTDIPAFIEGFQQRRLGPARTQVKTSVRAMVREAYWGKMEAEAALRPLGVRPDELQYMMLAEEIDYQNRFNDDQVRWYTEAYRKAEISRQDFMLALSTMIIKPERIAQIVAREDTRKLPKPKPLVEAAEDPLTKSLVRSAVTSYTKAYRDWEIDLQDLRLALNVILRNPTLVNAMIDAEALRYRPPPPE